MQGFLLDLPLISANNDAKGSEDQVVDANKTQLILPNKLRLLFLCLVAPFLVWRGRRECDVTLPERRLSQPNAIKVAPTQA